MKKIIIIILFSFSVLCLASCSTKTTTTTYDYNKINKEIWDSTIMKCNFITNPESNLRVECHNYNYGDFPNREFILKKDKLVYELARDGETNYYDFGEVDQETNQIVMYQCCGPENLSYYKRLVSLDIVSMFKWYGFNITPNFYLLRYKDHHYFFSSYLENSGEKYDAFYVFENDRFKEHTLYVKDELVFKITVSDYETTNLSLPNSNFICDFTISEMEQFIRGISKDLELQNLINNAEFIITDNSVTFNFRYKNASEYTSARDLKNKLRATIIDDYFLYKCKITEKTLSSSYIYECKIDGGNNYTLRITINENNFGKIKFEAFL